MKKNILFFNYMNSLTELYTYMLENSDPSKVNIHYSDTLYSKESSKFIFIKKVLNKFNQIGPLNLLKSYFSDETIVLAAGASAVYRKISDKVVLFDHGWGVKRTPGLNEIKKPERLNNYRNIKSNTQYIICINDRDKDSFLNTPELSNIPEPGFIPLGMPRNDILIQNINNTELINETFKKLNINKNANKVYLYAPTFREIENENYDMFNMLFSEFDNIDQSLKEKNIYLLFRPHYFITDIKNRLSKYSNIIYAGSDDFPDSRPLMIISDAIITDYSSIFVDYLLIDKPVIFYAFDLEKYQNIRGLITDYNNPLETPGPLIKKLEDILELNDKDFNRFDLEKSKSFYHKYHDQNSCRRITNFILNDL